MTFLPAELIKKKRRGETHSLPEIQFLLTEYVAGRIPDYQISAWLMAICFQGMTMQETVWMTQTIKDSGVTHAWPAAMSTVDKHSTGGVGDKTSLILAPLVASAGVSVPMVAGRGLGFTGGTLDKLESIPGFNTRLTPSHFQKIVTDLGAAIIGQNTDLCPADRKLYALRDVTGTVDSLPLICSSIMSKKLAEGLKGLVLDVKFGSGAFMKTKAQAEELASNLQNIGESAGVHVNTLLTSMAQPLGRFVGNSLEVFECMEIMDGKDYLLQDVDLYRDVTTLTLQLAGHMIFLGDKAETPEDGVQMAKDLLSSGQALKRFEAMCEAQGGNLQKLPRPERKKAVLSKRSGYITKVNTETIGLVGILLGAGRRTTADTIDPEAGIEVRFKLGSQVKAGSELFWLYGNNSSAFAEAERMLLSSVDISDFPAQAELLIGATVISPSRRKETYA